MAVPIVSGLGAIGVVIGLSTKATNWFDLLSCLIGVILFGAILYLCLILGEPFMKKSGGTGIGALNRIMGFLILAIAVQLITDGLIDVLKESAPNLLN
jgi:multiple antibiotic resistance protein